MASFFIRHVRAIMVCTFVVVMMLWGKVAVPFIVDNYGLAGTLVVVGACLLIARHWDRRKADGEL
jgi:hypothetical protein